MDDACVFVVKSGGFAANCMIADENTLPFVAAPHFFIVFGGKYVPDRETEWDRKAYRRP